MPRGTWNVVCPGPSTMSISAAELLDEAPIVCINRALGAPIGRLANVWAVWDRHELIWEECSRNFHAGLTIWTCPPLNRHAAERCMSLEKKMPLTVGFRSLPFGGLIDGEKNRNPFTLLAVLDYICEHGGAKHIRIFGADMRGTWRVKELDRWEDTDEDILETGWDRWAHERSQLDKVIRIAAENGIVIERFVPPPPSAEPVDADAGGEPATASQAKTTSSS